MAEIVSLKMARSKSGCPLCGKPENHDSRPFCSKRCADIELGKWLNEDYRIASREEAGPDEEPFDGQ